MRLLILLLLSGAALLAQQVSICPAGSSTCPATLTAGTGLNDATAGGTFTGVAANHQYTATICATGSPDAIAFTRDGAASSGCTAHVATSAQAMYFTAGSISAASWSSGRITFTTSAAHNMTTGETATVNGASPSGYNISGLSVLVLSPTTFSVAVASTPGTYTSGGTAYASDGVTIQWAATTGHTSGAAWTVTATANGSANSMSTVQRGMGALVARNAQDKMRDRLSALDFAGVDSTGTSDSTAGLQACINQSSALTPCVLDPGTSGKFLISSSGLTVRNGQAFIGPGSGGAGNINLPTSAPTLIMNTANMTAIDVEGYNTVLRGFNITKTSGLAGGTGVLVDVSTACTGCNNTSSNVLDDLYIFPDDAVHNLLTAGVKINGSAAGEVVFTRGHRVHVQGAIDAWWDQTTAAQLAAGKQDNGNSCTDCFLEQSARCIHLTSVGESTFNGTIFNGCNALSSAGSITLTNGSAAVTGTGTDFVSNGSYSPQGTQIFIAGNNSPPVVASVTDGTHLTLSGTYSGSTVTLLQGQWAMGEAPFVADSVSGNGAKGNLVQWNSGEPAFPLAVFDSYTEGNQIDNTLEVSPGGGTGYQLIVDLTGGKNIVRASSGNLLTSYDINGFPQVWTGQVQAHTAQQYATLQVSEASNPGAAGKGQNTIFRIQSAQSPATGGGPVGAAWLNFNPYGYAWQPSFAYAAGMIVIDPAGHIQTVITPGTSAAGTGPTWNDTGGTTTSGSVVFGDGGSGGGGANGLYLNTASFLLSHTLSLDTSRTDIYGSGGVDFVHGTTLLGSMWTQNVNSCCNTAEVVVAAENAAGTTVPVAYWMGDGGLKFAGVGTAIACNADHLNNLYYLSGVSGTSATYIYMCGLDETGAYKTAQIGTTSDNPFQPTPLSINASASTAQSSIYTNAQGGATKLMRITSQVIPPLGTYASAYTEFDLWNQGTAGYVPALILNSLGVQIPTVPSSYKLACASGTWASGNPPTAGTEGTLNYVLSTGGGPGYLEVCASNGTTVAEQQVLTAGSIANQATVSPTNPLWLYAHFRDDDQTSLYLAYSMDAKSWQDVNPGGSYAPTSGQVRDTTVSKQVIGGVSTYVFMATPASACNVQIFTSTDLKTFSNYSTFNLGSFVSGCTDSWAPELWTDPVSGAVGFFITMDTNSNASPYTWKPYWCAFSLTSLAPTGCTQFTINGTSRNQIFDLFPYYDAAHSTYYLMYADQSGNTPTQYGAYATSTSLTGTYTTQSTAGSDYFGFASSPSNIVASEAPIIITMPNGCLRVYMDQFDLPYPAGREYWVAYRDYTSPACGGTLPFATALDSVTQMNIPAAEHGTIIPLTSPADAQLVYNAAYTPQSVSAFNGRVAFNSPRPYRYSFTITSRAAHTNTVIQYNEPATYAADPGDGNIATLSACGATYYTCQPPYGGSGRWIINYTGTGSVGNTLQLNTTQSGVGPSISFSHGVGTYGQGLVNSSDAAAVWLVGTNDPCFGPTAPVSGVCQNPNNDWFSIHSGGTNDYPLGIEPSTGKVYANYGIGFGGGGSTGVTQVARAALYTTSAGVLELSTGTLFSGTLGQLNTGGYRLNGSLLGFTHSGTDNFISTITVGSTTCSALPCTIPTVSYTSGSATYANGLHQ